MANGDKDDKKKQQAGDKNVRVLRPQGSGATKSFGDVLKDTKKFITETAPEAVKKAVTTVPLEAPQGFDIAETIGVDAYGRDKKPVNPLFGNEGKAGFNTTAEQRARGGGRFDETTPEQDLSDQVKTPKLFGDMGQPATGEITDTTPQSNIRVVGSGPFGRQEVGKIGRSDFELEAEKFQRDQDAAIAAFDDDGDGVLSDKERDNQRAFQRQELLTGFRERKERFDKQFEEINARREEKALREKEPTIDTASTRAAMMASSTKKEGPKFGALTSMANYISDLGKKGASGAPLSKNLVVSGIRRKDFGSDKGFLDAVRAKGSPSQPEGSALRQAPRELGSLSGRLRRAGRAARRDGATAEANKLFGAAAMQGLREPNILSEEQRGRIAARQREAQSINESNRAFEKKLNEYASRVLDARIKGLQTGGLTTGGLRVGNMGPVFRPDGAVTSTYSRGDGTRGTMTTRRRPDMGAGMNFVDFEGT